MTPKTQRAVRLSRYIAAFLIVAALAMLLGGSFPKPVFAVVVLVIATVFGVLWLWLATVIPSAASESVRELNYHPDADVRALQKREISIEEYARRTEIKQ